MPRIGPVLVLGLLGLMAVGLAVALLLPLMIEPPPRPASEASGVPMAPPPQQVVSSSVSGPQPAAASPPSRKRPSPEGNELYQAGGDREKIKAILARGVDIDALNQVGWTALEGAAINGDVELVRFLLDAGADPNARDGDGDTAMGQVSCVDLAVAELLIERGAEVNVADDFVRHTPLHHCADRGDVAVIELLVAHGAEVNAVRKDGSTPLHDAAHRGHREVVELLLRHGADAAARDAEQRTPLLRALEQRAVHVVPMLADPAVLDTPNARGVTPLIRALYEREDGTARWLVDQGADVTRTSHSGETALHVAASYSTVDMVAFLLDHGADVNATDESGGSALDRAEFKRNGDIAALLIERGAHVERYRCTEHHPGFTRGYLRRGGCPPGVEATKLPDQSKT